MLRTSLPVWAGAFRLVCFCLCASMILHAGQPISHPTPPREPSVPPSVARSFLTDKNADRIQDSLGDRAQRVTAIAGNPTKPADRIAAQQQLDELVSVELIFSQQISQKHLDDFLGHGGEVTHIYEATSYGWNGRLPLGKVLTLPKLMGDALVQIEEDRPAVLHLDQATRNGRVRPVWAAGFAGNPLGYDGDTNITISVLDTGVDETHMDLNGRRVFWHDYTSDNEPNPYDRVQHGTHCAGIAFGTGAAAGLATGNLQFTDEGDLTGVTAGSFYPSPFSLSPIATTVNLVATWQGGGSTTLYLVYHDKGTAGGFTAQSTATGTSPLTLNVPFTPLSTRAYSAALLAASGVAAYNVTVQASSFEAIGDGFNKLRGVAPDCRWAGAKVFSNTGTGSSLDISAGIDGLVANRVANNIKVMNISLGVIGNPGISTSQRAKVNTAVNNGIVVCCSAGNDGSGSSTGAREVDDPGRAALAITVAAANDVNQLTDYTSSGFTTITSTAGQEEDYKPDLMAPGGSASYYTSIMSVDSNSGDGQAFGDQRTNDYYNIQGTSMASPFIAGCAALVIDALQQSGTNWSFASSQHPRLVKMLLCATTTESNTTRDSNSNNPTLQRAAAGPSGFPVGKDPFEGYGMVNPDAAVEAVALSYAFGTSVGDTFGGNANDKRAWARSVQLPAGANFNVNLTVPGTGDFDLYLYSRTPNTYGTPILLASSTGAGLGAGETINYTPTITTNAILVVKRVSGSGTFSLVGTGPIVANFTGAPTNGSVPLLVAFTNLSTGATNYLWNFGDGNFSSATNPANTYVTPGTYSVTLTAVGASGTNSFTRTSYIIATNPPGTLANFSGSPLSGMPPLAVTFTNTSTSATNFLWDFGDGQSSTATNAVHNYTNPGVFTVALTAIGNTGTNTLTRTNYITVTNFLPVTVNFAASPTNGFAPMLVTFTNLSANATNHLWDFGDGSFSSVLNPTHTFANAGLYTITLNSTGPGGSNSLTRVNFISVSNAPPLITAQPASLITTQGNNAAFTVSATGTALQYQWRKNAAVIPGANATTLSLTNVQPSDIALYSVIVSNTSGSVISSNASLTLVTSNDEIIVTGPPYLENFNVMGSSGTTAPHGWFVGTGTAAVSSKTVASSTGSSSTGGNYNFGSSGNSDRALGSLAASSGQRDTEARFVNESGSAITSFTVDYTGEQWRVGGSGSVNNALVMQYSLDGVNFTAMGVGFDFNTPIDSGTANALDGNSSGNRVTGLGDIYTPSPAIPDGQVFYLRWADANDTSSDHAIAVDDLTITFTLSNPPPPAVVVNFTANPTNGLAPLLVNFTNLSSGATNYSWTFGDGNNSAATNPSNTYTNAGSYSVTLMAIGAGGTNSVTFTNYITVTNAPPPPPPPAPVVNFIADITAGLAPLIVNFTNLSTNAMDFAWTFGDGHTATNTNPSNTYSNAGTFSVSLTAIGLGGTNSVTLTDYIIVTNAPPPPPPAPVANFIADITGGLAPQTVTFTNLSTNATNFAWTFGDGHTATNASPSNTYTNAGTFTVSLTAIGLGGTNSVTFTNYITVTNAPPPPPPILVVVPANLSFGSVFTGMIVQASFVISNAGGSQLNGSANLNAPPFALLDADTNVTPSFAFTVSPLAATNVQIRFSPVAPGVFTNVVTFLTDGGNAANEITGTAFGTPVLLDSSSSGSEFVFAFQTVADVSYTVQFKNTLGDALWQTLSTVTGDGSLKTITNLTATPAQRFYRLSVP